MRCTVLVLGMVAAATSSYAGAPSAVDRPALTASVAELRALPGAAGGETEILLSHHELRFEDSGGVTRREHWIVVLQDAEAIEDWSSSTLEWRPASEDRPDVRARVISPDGTIATLDPARVTEPASTVPEVRLVRLEVPAMTEGAILEEEFVYHDHALAPAGDSRTVQANEATTAVIELSAPVARKARVAAVDLPRGVRPVHQVKAGRESWRYQLGAVSERLPRIGLTTAASWARVADELRARVEASLASPPAWPDGVPRAATLDTVQALAGWIRGHVEVRQARFAAPAPPGETIARGRGTSSDVAAVWLALLRQAGVAAELAVYAAAWELPLIEGLPGAAPFDRVLVRARVAGREVWISPDAPLLQPGLLPSGAGGQRALVLAAGTRDLTATPLGSSADHTVREDRAFTAAEAGGAQVTVVTHETGALEAEQRSWWRTAGDEIQPYFERQAEAELAGKLERQSAVGVDPGQPLAVTMVVRDSRTVYTEREQLDLYFYPRSTLVRVPWEVRGAGRIPEAGFTWPVPHRYEIENRVAIPIGYTLPVPAPDRVRTLGTAQLAEHQALDGRTLIVAFRFDSGKPRVTAAELRDLRAELERLSAETVHIKLPLTASALAEAGKPREAIAEASRLVQQHPKEAIHHLQLSAILLRAGAGEAARREARAAIQLAPGDADPQVVLGYTLLFDTLGRSYGFDWDRDGAIAALRKARALDANHLGAVVHLTDALIHNRAGRYAEAGADIPGALEAARAAQALDDSGEQLLDLVRVLVRADKLAEAREQVEAMSEDAPYRTVWRIALAGAIDGPGAAVQVASALPAGAARTAAVDPAIEVLLLIRQYGAARGLAAALGTAEAKARAAVTAHPPVPTGSKDPRVAAMDVLIACADGDRASSNFWSPEVERGFRAACARERRGARNDTAAILISDSMQSSVTLTVEGDPEAWRISGNHDGHRFAMYFALDRGAARYLGDADQGLGVGQHLDRLLARGRDEPARRLAAWLASDGRGAFGVRTMWGPGAARDHDQLVRLAGALLVDGDPARALALLGRCPGLSGDAERICHDALLEAAFHARRWTDVVAQDAWLTGPAVRPSRAAWGLVAEAYAQLGRFDDAERVLADQLALHSGTPYLGTVRAALAARRGDVAEALRRADAVIAGSPTANDENQVAWLRLTERQDLDAALDLAHRAVRHQPRDPSVLNTLAAIEAELGDPAAALQHLFQAIPAGARPRNDDWFVLGRIYEQLGLTADALAAYRRVVPDRVPWGSGYELAARRLTALHAAH